MLPLSLTRSRSVVGYAPVFCVRVPRRTGADTGRADLGVASASRPWLLLLTERNSADSAETCSPMVPATLL